MVFGRSMAGNSPRCRMKTRLGLSAKTFWPAPQVHFSWPGSAVKGLGQLGTMSYGPNMSWPPGAPGMAANPAPGFSCAATGLGRGPSLMKTAKTIAIATSPATSLRIGFLPKSCCKHLTQYHLGAGARRNYVTVEQGKEKRGSFQKPAPQVPVGGFFAGNLDVEPSLLQTLDLLRSELDRARNRTAGRFDDCQLEDRRPVDAGRGSLVYMRHGGRRTQALERTGDGKPGSRQCCRDRTYACDIRARLRVDRHGRQPPLERLRGLRGRRQADEAG